MTIKPKGYHAQPSCHSLSRLAATSCPENKQSGHGTEPYIQKCGLLTGYVKPQASTSKRTAAGNVELQRAWHDLCTDMFRQVKERAEELLKDPQLVHAMQPWLQTNLDEECLHAMGKNVDVAGSKSTKKHESQNASSRYLYPVPTPRFFMTDSET